MPVMTSRQPSRTVVDAELTEEEIDALRDRNGLLCVNEFGELLQGPARPCGQSVGVYLPWDIAEALRDRAGRQERTLSSLLREIILDAVDYLPEMGDRVE